LLCFFVVDLGLLMMLVL